MEGFVGLLSQSVLIEVIPLLVFFFLTCGFQAILACLLKWFTMFTLKRYIIASFLCCRTLVYLKTNKYPQLEKMLVIPFFCEVVIL